VVRVYNLAVRCPMHESRDRRELREIKTIHERCLRDYSAYMERNMHAPKSSPGEHASAGARSSFVLSQWPTLAVVLLGVLQLASRKGPGASPFGLGGV